MSRGLKEHIKVMSNGHELALQHQATLNELANAQARFDALAGITAENLPKILLGAAVPILSVGFNAGGAYMMAYYGTKGAWANSVVAAAAWVGGMFVQDNPDVRNALYAMASGLGGSAAGVSTYNWALERKLGSTLTAAAPAPAAPAPAAS